MLTKKFAITLALYCLSLDTTLGKPFGDGVSPCKRSDPKLNECLLNVLRQAKPQLMNGNSKMNLPSLDPVKFPKASVLRNMQDIKINGELSNLIAKGASSMRAKFFEVNLNEKTWDMVIDIPLLTFVTDFNLNATIRTLRVPIFGKGQCEGKITQTVVFFHANTEVIDDKLKLTDIKIDLKLGDVEAKIIKPQYPVLAATALQFFNSNKRMVLDLITPIAEDMAQDMLLRTSNRILSTVKLTDLLVD